MCAVVPSGFDTEVVSAFCATCSLVPSSVEGAMGGLAVPLDSVSGSVDSSAVSTTPLVADMSVGLSAVGATIRSQISKLRGPGALTNFDTNFKSKAHGVLTAARVRQLVPFDLRPVDSVLIDLIPLL